MTPQELKNSILQLAIQGKLVEQCPEEGTGEELFQQIQVEKRVLIKAGKIKKEKPLPEITEDEIPFDIPDTWKWIRLSDVGQLKNGYSFKSTEYTSSGIQVVRISDLGEDAILSNDAVYYPLKDDLSPYIIENNSFLICMTGSIGKMAWVRDGVLRYLNQRVGMFIPNQMCCRAYLWYFLHTTYVINGWIRAKTSTNGNIKTSDITELVVPFPPLAEQKRIVAKLEEILPLIDRYEAAWNKLEEFNKRFPVDMQKSILQMAIQGKLVPQLSEEGTGEELFQQIQAEKQALIKAGKIKKEKPLPEIAEEEIPFDIPETWKWVRFSEVLDVRDGTHDTPKYVLDGVPLVTSKNLVDGRIDFETTKLISHEDAEQINMRSAVDDDDILFAMIGTIGNPVLVKKDREFCIKNMALFKAVNQALFSMDYLLLYLQNEQHSMKKKASGGVQSFVSLGFLRNYLLPLPPLEEQKRIVAKLEEILPLCERLK